jgi:hypothetical protein
MQRFINEPNMYSSVIALNFGLSIDVKEPSEEICQNVNH